ncbi:hypothetical protein [Gemmata obscuriglobus]|uniref:hypothetical protein n=1 Tax=Gemmata obscuriglobus TaxID=114 RepID=UPI001E4B6F1C|nr:hypothetical protein [Gemmata obscuriglobus]
MAPRNRDAGAGSAEPHIPAQKPNPALHLTPPSVLGRTAHPVMAVQVSFMFGNQRAQRMGSSEASLPLYDHCSLCGAAIRRCDSVVTIERHEEQVCANGDVEITRAEVLVSLCMPCGQRYPLSVTRVELGGQAFIGAKWPEAEPGAAPDTAR